MNILDIILFGVICTAIAALLFSDTISLAVAKFFKRGIESLEDIVGEFTTLDDKLGAFIDRRTAEAKEAVAQAEELVDSAKAADAEVKRAAAAQKTARKLAGKEE